MVGPERSGSIDPRAAFYACLIDETLASSTYKLLIFGIVDFSQFSPPLLTSRSFSRRVLGFALADGPVLKPDIGEVDEDILGADARCLSEPLGDRLVERLLLAGRTALVPRDLDDDQVIAAVDA